MPALIKKIILGLLVFVFFSISYSASVHAYTNNQNLNPDVPKTSRNNAQIVLFDLTSAISCQLIGIDPVNPSIPCLGVDSETGKIGYVKDANDNPKIGGVVGGLVNMIAFTYKIPIKTHDYTSYLAHDFGIIKKTYAQTGGFQNLSAILGMWKKVRDLTYLAFVFIFVLIGLGVMLRVKLDARTVMTLQNQIPKAVLYIILITFSYAIAGVLIDLMWVTTYTGINILSSGVASCGDGTSLAQKATVNLLSDPFSFVNKTLGCAFGESWNIEDLATKVGLTIGDILSRMFFAAIGLDIGSSSQSCNIITNTRGCFNILLSHIIGLIAFLAILIAIVLQLFRIWFNLIKSYLYVILYTITAPIWIIGGIIPNNTNFGFKQWLRRMFFALSLYPLTIFLFLVAVVLVADPTVNNPDPESGRAFIPPLIANPAIANNVGYIAALGVILLAPQVTEMAREMFKVSPSKYAPGIFQALGAGAASASAPFKKGWGALTKYDSSGNPQGLLAHAGHMATGNVAKRVVGGMGNGRVGTFLKKQFNTKYANVRYEAGGKTSANPYRNATHEAIHIPKTNLGQATEDEPVVRPATERPAPPIVGQTQLLEGNQERQEAEATAGPEAAASQGGQNDDEFITIGGNRTTSPEDQDGEDTENTGNPETT